MPFHRFKISSKISTEVVDLVLNFFQFLTVIKIIDLTGIEPRPLPSKATSFWDNVSAYEVPTLLVNYKTDQFWASICVMEDLRAMNASALAVVVEALHFVDNVRVRILTSFRLYLFLWNAQNDNNIVSVVLKWTIPGLIVFIFCLFQTVDSK